MLYFLGSSMTTLIFSTSATEINWSCKTFCRGQCPCCMKDTSSIPQDQECRGLEFFTYASVIVVTVSTQAVKWMVQKITGPACQFGKCCLCVNGACKLNFQYQCIGF